MLLTAQGRVYAPGAGGKLLMRADGDAATGTFAPQFFYGAAAYSANPAAFDGSVFINTPLTADAQGNIFFGFQVTGANPAGLVSGIARVSPDGTGIWVGAATAAGDPAIQKPAMNCAPRDLERRRHDLHRGEHRRVARPAAGLPARARQHDARGAREGRVDRSEPAHPRADQRRRARRRR